MGYFLNNLCMAVECEIKENQTHTAVMYFQSKIVNERILHIAILIVKLHIPFFSIWSKPSLHISLHVLGVLLFIKHTGSDAPWC